MMSNRSYDKRFHAIDIDPYGSASMFLSSAVQAVADEGISLSFILLKVEMKLAMN